jgi:hypothetical protein
LPSFATLDIIYRIHTSLGITTKASLPGYLKEKKLCPWSRK